MEEHVTVFFQVKDRGFQLHVPKDQEDFYIKARDSFKVFVERHKSKGHDDMEAIALTSIEALVAMQRSHAQLEKQKQELANIMGKWDEKVEEALKN